MSFRFNLPHFRRLQWKLTLTYTLVTAVAILLVEIALLGAAALTLARSNTLPRLLLPLLEDSQSLLVPALRASPPNVAVLDAWLHDFVHTGSLRHASGDAAIQVHLDPATVSFAAITNARGQPFAVIPSDGCTKPRLSACLPPEGQTVLRYALAGEESAERLAARTPNGILLAAPLRGDDHRVAGSIFLQISLPRSVSSLSQGLLTPLISSALLVLLFAALIGTVFGFLTARSLTRRLALLSQAADAWSRGEFSRTVHDASADELGALAHRLNRMAEQLENLLHARQELATLEERNRLARDLHDSVKQQVFAAGMQLATARHHLHTDAARAGAALAEAERLVRQAQQELTALIRELRPAALHDRGLTVALQEHVAAWARQTGIVADFRVQGKRHLPLEVEQTVFRVAQEALANVARHSGATRVSVRLAWDEDHLLRLEVEDDGRGFSPVAAHGQGLGLTSMEERLQRLGGSLHIASAAGQGTRLIAEVPLSPLSLSGENHE